VVVDVATRHALTFTSILSAIFTMVVALASRTLSERPDRFINKKLDSACPLLLLSEEGMRDRNADSVLL
jgi:hypothetical protein